MQNIGDPEETATAESIENDNVADDESEREYTVDDSDDEEETVPVGRTNRQKRTKQRSNEYNFKVFGNERNRKWNEWQGKQKAFPFTGFSGMNNQLSGQLATLEPIDYFMHFLDEEILN